MASDPSLFELMGGEPALRRAIDRFVERVFDDVMIGFHFRDASRERVKRMEYELAAVHLGAPGARYTGRPLREAHARHPIMGGQFVRRSQILSEVLEEQDVPEPVRQHWLELTERLRPLITGDQGSDCNAAQALARALGANSDGGPKSLPLVQRGRGLPGQTT